MTLVVHFASRALWPGYRHLRPREQRQWANKITCGLHVSPGRWQAQQGWPWNCERRASVCSLPS